MNLEKLFNELINEKDTNKLTSIIKEINQILDTTEYSFNNESTEELYNYMLLCNKLEIKDTLNRLVNNIDFIKILDNTKIDGSVLPSLTQICDKPRECLIKNSKKLKESIIRENGLLSAADILDDLTEEEIKLLREDIEIDNYLISHGLSFSTLKDETIKRLLAEPNIFKLYNIYTINEFANKYKDKEELVNNEAFLKIYFEKLTDNYNYENKIFKYLNIDKIEDILAKSPSLHILLHLLKDTKKDIQKLLLNNKEIIDYLKNCVDIEVLVKIPKHKLLNILKERKKLFQGSSLKILEILSEKDLQQLFKDNKYFYEELIENIASQTEENLNNLINALPDSYLRDLCNNKIINLDVKTINKLLKTGNEEIRKAILKNVELTNSIVNKTTNKTFDLLKELLDIGKYTNEEIIKILNNLTTIKEPTILNKLINIVPISLRKDIYNNDLIRKEIYKEEKENLDDYALNHLLNDQTELKNQSAGIIATVLIASDNNFVNQIIDDDKVLEKLLSDKDATDRIISVMNIRKKIISILKNKHSLDKYSKENIKHLLNKLSISDKMNLCNNDIVRKLLDNNEKAYTLYKKLSNNNKYLINTLNFDFLLLPDISEIKLNALEIITKYPNIQEDIITINKHYNIVPNFLNNILYNTDKLSLKDTLSKCLKILRETAEGLNRKKYGNIIKMITNYSDCLSKKEEKELINYLLYLIPRYQINNTLVERTNIIATPNSFYDILSYEKNYEEKLTELIKNSTENTTKEYFIMKHFKLNIEEAKIMLNMYSIDRIDSSIYKKEYNLLNDLKRIMNTDSESLKEMDSQYYTISMFDSFVIEKQIKEMYAKIYNYEIRSKTYSNKSFIKTIYGKELKIYTCPNDFLFLISNLNIKEEFEYTNSYFEAWHNTLNKSSIELNTSLISNDNLIINDDILFGFYGLLESGIEKMSNINLSSNNKNNTNEKYMTPRELIDNTRNNNNTIIIDRYAVRPYYNNSNIPTIEPDFIFVDINKLNDNKYLEMISRASEEFKTKRNKDGLPIIAYDINKISDNEVNKIEKLLNKYKKNYDMNLLPGIISKIENNYTAYILNDPKTAEKFKISTLINTVYERISKTNSLAELDFIEELFTRENNKLKEQTSNINLKELKEHIKERKNIVSN